LVVGGVGGGKVSPTPPPPDFLPVNGVIGFR